MRLTCANELLTYLLTYLLLFVAGCSSLMCGVDASAGGSCVDYYDICTECSSGYNITNDGKHCGSKYPSSVLASLSAKKMR